MFHIPDEPAKRKVFEAFVQERFKNFKSYLRTRWIHKRRKRRPKKNVPADGEEEKPDKKPWDLYPQITVDDWEKFVEKSSTRTALVCFYLSIESATHI